MLCMLIGLSVSAQQRQRMSAQERAQRETEMMKKELNLAEHQIPLVDSVNLCYAKKMDEVMVGGEREKMREARQTIAAEKEKALQTVLTKEQFLKLKELEKNRPGPGQRPDQRPGQRPGPGSRQRP